MRLELYHPNLPPCDQCRKWEHYTDGEKAGQPVKRKNREEKIPRRSKLPCDSTQGCPKGHWTEPKQLTNENWLAWMHYLECSAVGFSEQEQRDGIVRRNAAILRNIERERERGEQQKALMEFINAMNAAKLPRGLGGV